MSSKAMPALVRQKMLKGAESNLPILAIILTILIGTTALVAYKFMSKSETDNVKEIVIEAENMKVLRGPYADRQGLAFYRNGYASSELRLPKEWAGRNVIFTLVARADPAGEEPGNLPYRTNQTLILPEGMSTDDVLKGDLKIDPNQTINVMWLVTTQTELESYRADTANYSELVNYLEKEKSQIGKVVRIEEDYGIVNYTLADIKINSRNFTFVYEGDRVLYLKWPVIQLSLNGTTVGKITINSSEWQDFQTQPILLKGHIYTIEPAFTDDVQEFSETGDLVADRNFFLDKIRISVK
ncbi:hypothetical protein HYV82_04605 [Candidatus Woesearchaeota archaeon]|nr:hypothetical protein [Candidatus Woesearchaeota archaeon]